MARKKKKSSLPAILLFVVILLILGGIVLYLGASYKYKQNAYKAAVAAIAPFNEDEARAKVCAAKNLSPNAKPPTESEEAVRKKIAEELNKTVRTKFDPKELTRQSIELMKKYRMARTGDKVNFLFQPSESVSGVFTRVEESSAGPVVVVETSAGERRYARRRINQEFLYLFSEGDNRAFIDEKLAGLKKSFDEGREEMEKTLKVELEKKYFPEAGYGLNSENVWVPDADVIKDGIEQERAAWQKIYNRKLVELAEQYRFLGVIEVVEQPEAVAK